jgi:hypothetical protein
MKRSRGYIPGDRLVDCERCGFTYRFSQMRRETERTSRGLIVCPDCYDGPHPLEARVPNRPEGKLQRVR